MPASHIIILVLTCVLIALAVFTAYQINAREDQIAKLEVRADTLGHRASLHAARAERLNHRCRAEYARANDAEERTLSRNIFDEVANEYAWLQFPAEPGASASVYHFIEADLYDAALNSHEVR